MAREPELVSLEEHERAAEGVSKFLTNLPSHDLFSSVITSSNLAKRCRGRTPTPGKYRGARESRDHRRKRSRSYSPSRPRHRGRSHSRERHRRE